MPKAPVRNAFETYLAPKQPGRELDNARLLPLTQIEENPEQARQSFDEAALEELAASIRVHGVLQPIGVRPVGDKYRIIYGERRFRAAGEAHLQEIPCVIYEKATEQDAILMTALENLQREDLDPEEEARQFVKLLDATGLSVRALADKLGKHYTYVARRVRLLKERPDLFAPIRSGQLTMRQALEQAAEYAEGAPSTTADSGVFHGETFSGAVESSSAPTTADSGVFHGETLSGAVESSQRIVVNGRELFAEPPPVPRTPRAQMAPPGSRPRYRPVYSFNSWVQLIEPQNVPADEKPILRAELQESIKLAQAKLAALEAGEADGKAAPGA